MSEELATVWPVLYGESRTGKIKQWQISVLSEEPVLLRVAHGQKGGALTVTDKKITKGKNVGRSNETTPYEQACSDAASKFRKKTEKGYVEDEANITEVRLPMLAKVFDVFKKFITYPAFSQPKLNGVRCWPTRISLTEIEYTSREGKKYTTLDHLTPSLLKLLDVGETWDGEIYKHGWDLQDIVAAVKKYRPGVTEKLELWVYDVVDTESDFEERYKKYDNKIDAKSYDEIDAPINSVEAIQIHNEEDVYNAHNEYVGDGFEGAIIRNKLGGYTLKHRCKNLQKYKVFMDDEFEIVGGYEGTGTAEGHVTFICKTKEGKEFGVVPKGTFEYRAHLWKTLDKQIGKMLTVRFLEYSKDNLPIGNTVGIAIRDYE